MKASDRTMHVTILTNLGQNQSRIQQTLQEQRHRSEALDWSGVSNPIRMIHTCTKTNDTILLTVPSMMHSFTTSLTHIAYNLVQLDLRCAQRHYMFILHMQTTQMLNVTVLPVKLLLVCNSLLMLRSEILHKIDGASYRLSN